MSTDWQVSLLCAMKSWSPTRQEEALPKIWELSDMLKNLQENASKVVYMYLGEVGAKVCAQFGFVGERVNSTTGPEEDVEAEDRARLMPDIQEVIENQGQDVT